MVIICERDHRDITQYELYLSLISDPYFIENVGHVFTEVGVSTLNPALNALLHNDSLPVAEVNRRLLEVHRNATVWPLWEKYNYQYFLRQLAALNRTLPPHRKINLYPSDVPFRWSNIHSAAELQAFWRRYISDGQVALRDSIMALQISAGFDSLQLHTRRKKALVILNHHHAFNDFDPRGYHTGRFLFQKYGERVANVLVNNHQVNAKVAYLTLQRGRWDAAFRAAGVEDAGFDLQGSPFGRDAFDYYPDQLHRRYQEVFTGMVFYKPLAQFQLVIGVPGLVDEAFLPELLRREELLWQLRPRKHHMGPRELQSYYNTRRTYKLSRLRQMEREIERWFE